MWAITGRAMTGDQVDAIVDLAEAYAAERAPHQSRTALHHTSGTDLYPLIGVLAEALLGKPADAEGATIHVLRRVS